MPNKSIPTIGDSNWGTPLNAHLAQLQNPANGGINTFEQFAQRPTNLTADDAGKTYLYTQTGSLHQWTGTIWKVLNESVINVKDYGAVGDGVVDDTAAIQNTIDIGSGFFTGKSGGTVFVPQGRYRITSTLNCTSTPVAIRMELHIKFENRSSDYQGGTILIGETGINPVIDFTGTSAAWVENCGIISGTNNPSKIGILQARPDGGTGWCGRHKYNNLFIQLGSDLTANGNLGTIGFINIAGEESEYNNIEIWANLCYVNNKSKNIRTSNLNDTFNYFTVISPFGIPITPQGSNTVYSFTGACRMISYEYFSPAILIDETAGFNLGDTFVQKRFAPGANSTIGNYAFALECWNCLNFNHYGIVENCGQYMLLRRDLSCATIKITVVADTFTSNPIILLYGDGGGYGIRNSEINIANNTNNLPFIGFRNFSSSTYLIKNCNINDSRAYTETSVAKIILKNSTNTKYSFNDKFFEYKNHLIESGIAIPTTGEYFAGDIINNINPTPGGYVGWICTASGTPGTWKGFGLIAV